MTRFHLAQVNIGRFVAPIDDPRMEGFRTQLDPINALADRSPGFVWRLQTEDGNATAIRPFDGDDRMAINMSVWTSIEALQQYVYQSAHVGPLRDRKRWFEAIDGPILALWWIPVGHIPIVAEALDRLAHLKAHGPTRYAFYVPSALSVACRRVERCRRPGRAILRVGDLTTAGRVDAHSDRFRWRFLPINARVWPARA